MKKVLLIALSLFIGISINAQNKRLLKNPSKLYEAKKVNYDGSELQLEYVGSIPNEYVENRAQDIIFGTSIYDVQTNANSPRHIHVFEDGTITAVFTMGTEPTAYPERGTGYNYNNGSGWGDYPETRIEPTRCGWPNYAPYLENGEIICAHTGTASGLIFSYRENKGTGEWNYFYLVGPAGHEDLLWPRMITTGENNEIIHVIALTTPIANDGSKYEGINGALLYSRSSDGGQTWDPENEILDGLTSDDYGYGSADAYTWAESNDGVIAFIFNSGLNDGMIFKSEDNGDSWDKTVIFEAPYPLFDGQNTTLEFPIYYCPDGANDIIFDDEGKMHVAFGRTFWNSRDDGLFYGPGVDGLIYWKEGMPVLDSLIMRDPDLLEAGGYLAAYTLEGPLPGDTLKGITGYGTGLASMPQLAFHRDANNTPILDIFYSNQDWKRVDQQDNTYRSIWRVFTEDGGATWSEFENLTGDVFHLFTECVFPSIATNLYDDTYHLVYQSDSYSGLFATTTPAQPEVTNNMVYLPVEPLAVDIAENISTITEVSQNYPNPFKGSTYVNVNLSEGSNLTMEVYSITGQKLAENNYGYRNAGTQTLTIDAHNLKTGVYFYTITAGDQKVTRKMMVE